MTDWLAIMHAATERAAIATLADEHASEDAKRGARDWIERFGALGPLTPEDVAIIPQDVLDQLAEALLGGAADEH